MPRRSSHTAGITWFDEAERRRDIRRAVARAAGPLQLRRAVLFGSLARGGATASSDADLLLVVAYSEHSRPRDRIPGALQALRPLPCPLDLFVYTEQEVQQLREEGSALLRTIEASGVELL